MLFLIHVFYICAHFIAEILFPKSFYRADHMCWIHGNSLYFGFLLPIGIMLFVNFIFAGVVLKRVVWRKKKVSKYTILVLSLVTTAICKICCNIEVKVISDRIEKSIMQILRKKPKSPKSTSEFEDIDKSRIRFFSELLHQQACRLF